jgi:hypothetical protein
MKLYAHYIKLQERMRFHHYIEADLPLNSFTRDVSPTTAALNIIFRQQLVMMGSWRDCMACDENWRKLKVIK